MQSSLRLFFGKAADFPISFKNSAAFIASLEDIATNLNISQLTVDNQVHGTAGRIVAKRPQAQPIIIDYKSHDGDFLITSERNIAIGVHTADCLPLVFYAPDKHVIAVAHAGWRGSVAGIGTIVAQQLVADFDIDMSKLLVFFGPAGGACCYEIKDDFITSLEQTLNIRSPFALWARPSTGSGRAATEDLIAESTPAHGELVEPRPEGVEERGLIIKRNGKLFFNNAKLNLQQLRAAGVDEKNIDISNNICTICNHEYHSYRRSTDKNLYNTQATIAWLE